MSKWCVKERHDGVTTYTPFDDIFAANVLFYKIVRAGGSAIIVRLKGGGHDRR